MINDDNIIYIFLGLFLLDMITTSIGMSMGLTELNPAYNNHIKNILIHIIIGGIIYWYHFKVKNEKTFRWIMSIICIYYLAVVFNNLFLIF